MNLATGEKQQEKGSSNIHPPTVFIVDDDPDVRRTIALLIRSVDLAAEQFATADEFIERYDPSQPGCLVLDMRMPGISGHELQKELAAFEIAPPIIFISGYGEISNATEALRQGAVDFLSKPYNPQLLLERVHEAIEIDAKQRETHLQRSAANRRVATLTEREKEVMSLLAEGLATKVIAKRLGISTKTVDNHRGKILEKMKVENATQLAHLINCL